MKPKAIYTTILFLFFLNIAFSQQNNGISFKTGPVFSNQKHVFTDIDYTIETESLIGMNAMLGFHHSLKQSLNMVAEIGYVRKGSKTEFESVTVNHLQNDALTVNSGELKTSTFDYISINLGAQYFILKQKPGLYLSGALRIDNLMKYKTESDYKVIVDHEVLAGLNAGIGYSYSIGKYALFIESQWLFDFTKVMDSKGIELKNNAYSISAGLIYSLVPKQ